MKPYFGIELVCALCGLFGPSGCEEAVRDFIAEQIEGYCDSYRIDRAGNLIATIKGRGPDYNEENPDKFLISAHMDEVGMMINRIDDAGYMHFDTVGGIDPRVLCGRQVTVMHGETAVPGVIASKAIHLQSKEERTKVTPLKKLYIDIGATDKADAEQYAAVGDCATFHSDFVAFGKDDRFMKGKALDDRCGCAALIEIMRELYRRPTDLPFDVCFAFTRCEEVGISGAAVAAFGVAPKFAIVLDASAVNDVADAAPATRVATQGKGGMISLADRGTIYDTAMIRFAEAVAAKAEIPCQIKQATTGANDAAHVQRSLAGVRVMALSLPTRYIHSASCVAAYEDHEAICRLIVAMLKSWKLS